MANIYFFVGAYEDAIKLYTNLLITSKNQKEILVMRNNCYMIVKELNNALSDMDKIIKISNDPKSLTDY